MKESAKVLKDNDVVEHIFFIMSGLGAETVHMGHIIISHAGAQAHAKEKKMQKKEITKLQSNYSREKDNRKKETRR